MALDSAAITACGDRLAEAYRSGEATAPLSADYDLTVADAYRVQEAFVGRREAGGADAVGYKVGFTSGAVREQFDVDEPIYGRVFDDAVSTASTLDTATLHAPRLEPELVFVLGESLGGPATAREVLAATDAVLPAVEVVDSRTGTWDLTPADAVADNSLASRLLLAEGGREVTALDLSMEGVQVRVDGDLRATGLGADVLGHPVRAVTWLSEALSGTDESLTAGDVVATGSLTPALSFGAGDVVEARFGTLGTVTYHAD
jgi:2-keto-4-pentenoate hydratase